MLAAQGEKANAITSAQCEDATKIISGRSSEASKTGSAHYFVGTFAASPSNLHSSAESDFSHPHHDVFGWTDVGIVRASTHSSTV